MLEDLAVVFVEAVLVLLHLAAEGSDRGVLADDAEWRRLLSFGSSMVAQFWTFHGWHEGCVTDFVHDVGVQLEIWVDL